MASISADLQVHQFQ